MANGDESIFMNESLSPISATAGEHELNSRSP